MTKLRYVGTDRFIFGVPARDLEDEDIDRLVYHDERLKPGDKGHKAAAAARVSSLVGSGVYAGEGGDAPRGKARAGGSGKKQAESIEPATADTGAEE